jgi:hypothetical protein
LVKTRIQAQPPGGGQVPPGFSDFVDALDADPHRDILILKRRWGAFCGTDLDLQLRRHGVTNIVLCGISTSIGVESTARDACCRRVPMVPSMQFLTDQTMSAIPIRGTHGGRHSRRLVVQSLDGNQE